MTVAQDQFVVSVKQGVQFRNESDPDVVVVPSKNLVVVRLGLSVESGRNINDTQGMGRLVAAIAAAVGG